MTPDGTSSADDSPTAPAVPATAPLPTGGSLVERPPGEREAELKSLFQQRMYEVLLEPKSLQALRELLRGRDLLERRRSWELLLKHLVPTDREGDGGRAVNLFLGVPRPAGTEARVIPVDPSRR